MCVCILFVYASGCRFVSLLLFFSNFSMFLCKSFPNFFFFFCVYKIGTVIDGGRGGWRRGTLGCQLEMFVFFLCVHHSLIVINVIN